MFDRFYDMDFKGNYSFFFFILFIDLIILFNNLITKKNILLNDI